MPSVTDDFNRANNSSLGANWTTAPASSGNDNGGFAVASNAASNNGLQAGSYYTGAGAFSNDQYAEVVMTTLATTWNAVRVRGDTSTPLYYSGGNGSAGFGNNRARIWKTVGTVRTSLAASASVDIVAGDTVRLEVSGTTLTLKVNGVTQVTTTDSSATAGYPGLGARTAAANCAFDNFAAGDLGGTLFTKSVAGSITMSGTLNRKTSKRVTGSLTASGTVVRKTKKNLFGTVTTTGLVYKKTRKKFTGSITGTASESNNYIPFTGGAFFKSLAGSITMVGNLTKKVKRPLAGSITPTGSVTKLTRKKLVGAITGTGTVVRRWITKKAVAGVITMSGTVSGFKFTPVISEAVGNGLNFLRRYLGRR